MKHVESVFAQNRKIDSQTQSVTASIVDVHDPARDRHALLHRTGVSEHASESGTEERFTALSVATRPRPRAQTYAWIAAAALLLPAGLVIVVAALSRRQEDVRREFAPSDFSSETTPITPPAQPSIVELASPAVEAAAPVVTPPLPASATSRPSVSAAPASASASAPDSSCEPPYTIDPTTGHRKYRPCMKAPAVGPPVPFDRTAAAAALGRVDLHGCEKYSGVNGSGHVLVTFDPSGAATDAHVDGGPFVGAGRAICAAARFRAVVVPPFNGPSVRVGKTFSIP